MAREGLEPSRLTASVAETDVTAIPPPGHWRDSLECGRGARAPLNRAVADLGVEPSIQAYETQSGAGPSAMSFAVVMVGFEPTLSTF